VGSRVGRTQRVRVRGQLSEEVRVTSDVRVTSGVAQGSVLSTLSFLAYFNSIWRNILSTIRLFADDCVIYRQIVDNEDIENIQKDLNWLGEWAAKNVTKINPSKYKAVRFTRTRVNDPLNYTLRNQFRKGAFANTWE
jgi:hypothetical protein